MQKRWRRERKGGSSGVDHGGRCDSIVLGAIYKMNRINKTMPNHPRSNLSEEAPGGRGDSFATAMPLSPFAESPLMDSSKISCPENCFF